MSRVFPTGGIIVIKFCPKVNLSESFVNKTMAAVILRQAGQPEATGSSSFGKAGYWPLLWAKCLSKDPFRKPPVLIHKSV